MRVSPVVFAALAAAAAIVPVGAQTHVPGVDAYVRLQTLEAQLLATRSATQTLETWCRDHRLADTPRVVARRVAPANKPPTAAQRRRLDVDPGEPVRYRRVELACGDRVLSVAENWYVPGRLTTEMNRLLDTTDTPFGRAVAPLEPSSETFAVKVLWTDSSQPMPPALFEHRAVLYTKDHRPFSEVDETYRREVLDR